MSSRVDAVELCRYSSENDGKAAVKGESFDPIRGLVLQLLSTIFPERRVGIESGVVAVDQDVVRDEKGAAFEPKRGKGTNSASGRFEGRPRFPENSISRTWRL